MTCDRAVETWRLGQSEERRHRTRTEPMLASQDPFDCTISLQGRPSRRGLALRRGWSWLDMIRSPAQAYADRQTKSSTGARW